MITPLWRPVLFGSVLMASAVLGATTVALVATQGDDLSPPHAQVEQPPVIVTASRLRVGELGRPSVVFLGPFEGETAESMARALDDFFDSLSPDQAEALFTRWDQEPWRRNTFVFDPSEDGMSRGYTIMLDQHVGLPQPSEWPTIENESEIFRAVVREYPRGLLQEGQGGTVGVDWLISADGAIEQVRLRQASRYPELDAAALRVAEEYDFAPALHDGEPVSAWVTGPISFRSKG